MSERNTVLEFPCRFPVKAMGRSSSRFEQIVSDIVLTHARLYPGEALQSRVSRDGNFVSVTAVIEAESKQQLDALYQALTDADDVIMAL